MYFPIGWPRVLKLPPCDGVTDQAELRQVVCNRDKILTAIITSNALQIWYAPWLLASFINGCFIHVISLSVNQVYCRGANLVPHVIQVREAMRAHHKPPEAAGVDRGTRREHPRAMEARLVHDLRGGEHSKVLCSPSSSYFIFLRG